MLKIYLDSKFEPTSHRPDPSNGMHCRYARPEHKPESGGFHVRRILAGTHRSVAQMHSEEICPLILDGVHLESAIGVSGRNGDKLMTFPWSCIHLIGSQCASSIQKRYHINSVEGTTFGWVARLSTLSLRGTIWTRQCLPSPDESHPCYPKREFIRNRAMPSGGIL